MSITPLNPSHQVFISVGSNTPDKDERMREALRTLTGLFPDLISSDIYSTPCYRGEGEDYLNAVACFTTAKDLAEIESICKDMEDKAGRTKINCNIVSLDLDIVVFDGKVLRLRDFDRKYFIKGYFQLTNPGKTAIADYQYSLPDSRIANHPLGQRDGCKLLVIERNGDIFDTFFNKIGDFLPSNSILIYNNTRVINARLRFCKPSGAQIEIFCLEPVAPADYQLNLSSCHPVRWKCLVGNSKRWKEGTLSLKVTIGNTSTQLNATRIVNMGNDSIIEFSWDDDQISFSEIIESAGNLPIPPYLNRETETSDLEDYQTVYGVSEGSVAAPTAGLHFTTELLDRLRKEGIETRDVTLHVGAGTFQPVKSLRMDDHPMHAELIDVELSLIEELAQTRRPVTAVGTTTVRTLESLYYIGCAIAENRWNGQLEQWAPYNPEYHRLSVKEALSNLADYLKRQGQTRLIATTSIIIAPSYKYKIVDNLITNFHQPGSTLLLLVAAITGERWREIYRHALENDYRFLSYGDACLFRDIKN